MGDETIAFKEAQFRDGRHVISLEESIRRCSAFSGIHDFDFADTVSELFVSFDDWVSATGATFDVSGSNLVGTGGGSSIWYQARHDTEIAPSFIASFDLVDGHGGFVFRGCSSDDRAFVLYWNAATCGAAYIDADNGLNDLTVMPYGTSGPARIQVAVKYILDSVDDERKWLSAALWVDGSCYVSFNLEISDATYTWTGNEIGFAVYGSNAVTVDNLDVSEVGRIVEYTSVDPGETPGVGMSRAVGTTRLRWLARYDGTMRVWRPGNRDLDWTVPADRPIRFNERDDRTAVATHIRTFGAAHEVDRFDDDEGDVHMHRFHVHDDPNLMSEEEVYTEAGLVLNDATEEQKTMRMTLPPQPTLEVHDRVAYDGEDYRVKTLSITMNMTRKGPRFSGVMLGRRYIAV